MGTILGKTNISNYYNTLSRFISFYSEKFAEYVTVTDNSGETPSTYTYNITAEVLGGYANKIVNIIGGLLFSTSHSTPSSSTEDDYSTPQEPPSSNGSIIPLINTAFTAWFKDFNYDNAMMLAGEAWIDESEIKQSSEYKIKGISLLNSCSFINPKNIEMSGKISAQFSTLDQVKSYLDDNVNYISVARSYIEGIINSIDKLRDLYSTKIMEISSNSMYASNADYMSHQIYNDYYAKNAISSWAPLVGKAINAAESTIPELIDQQISDLERVVRMINNVSTEISVGVALSKIENLKTEIRNQYLSHYVENYGHRIAAIISDLMSAIPEDYDYKLTDKLITIEQEIESTVSTAASRYTVYNKFGSKYLSGVSISDTHSSLLRSLRIAVGRLNALSN